MALQSGTSADGIDLATVDVAVADEGGRVALELTPQLMTTLEWPQRLRGMILEASHGAVLDAPSFTRLDTELGQCFAAAAAEAALRSGPVEAIASHGQTLHHWTEPRGGAQHTRGTLQLGEPSWIAEAVGAPVISHLRSADVAAGGEGAPLMGVFDQLWLAGLPLRERGEKDETGIATVNLGGIANVQILRGDQILAFDAGPANCLLDAVVSERSGQAYDVDGRLAASGRVLPALLERLLAHPYFVADPPKSTGRETWNAELVDQMLGGESPEVEDLLATLTALTAESVVRAVRAAGGAPRIVLSGGGARNPVLVSEIQDRGRPAEVICSEVLGIEPEHKESLLFAVLGALAWFRVPVKPGPAPARIAGRFTPGPDGLDLPEPLDRVDAIRLLPTSP